MNLFLKSVFISIIVSFSGMLYAQTETKIDELLQLSMQFNDEWDEAQKRVDAYCNFHNVPRSKKVEGHGAYLMIDVQNGKPVYYMLENLGAAKTTRVDELWKGGSSGLELDGEGYDLLGEWDGGTITTHQEFTDQGASRLTRMDGGGGVDVDHGTHVAGTLIAAGIANNAHGMANAAKLKAWSIDNDNSEMASAAANGLEISNHSYGIHQGWVNYGNGWGWTGNSSIDPNEDYTFGFYTTYSKIWDVIAFNAPNYLIFKAAGNQRGDGPPNAGQEGVPEKNGGDDGFDCITHRGISKNAILVGAVHEVEDYQSPGDVRMASFSSWGPCDDGRIKPDIVGKGVDVLSTSSASNTSYTSKSGTSMATPNVCGSAVLLRVLYQDLNSGDIMKASTLKGLILHTADEAGPHPGPDYMFGWGLMNSERAAMLIKDDQGQNSIDELVLGNGESYTTEINVLDGTPELRVSICWTDPAGNVLTAQLNPRTPMLVNNLDLSVNNSSDIFYPYKLDPENPSAKATNDSENDVDNVEIIVIDNPEPGKYTISVNHDGSLSGGQQAFSLIVTGIDDYTVVPECTVDMITPESGSTDILVNEMLEWVPATFSSSYDIYFGTDGGGVQTPTNVFNGENITSNYFSHYMLPNTTYYLQVVPRNNQGVAVGCNEIWEFTTMEAITEYPYHETFANVVIPDLPFGYQSVDIAIPEWQSTDFIGNTDSRSSLCYKTGDIVKSDYDNWLISPPFALNDGMEYNLSFYYKSFLAITSESMSVYWGTTPYIEDMTNLVFENTDFSDANWLQGGGVIIPGKTMPIYLGFHINSTQGNGVFVDDIEIEDWGPVTTNNLTDVRNTTIYSFKGHVHIEADPFWKGSDIFIRNMMGQLIYKEVYNENVDIDVKTIANSGLYIISLSNKNIVESKKVIIE